jgi:hypothetical protein
MAVAFQLAAIAAFFFQEGLTFGRLSLFVAVMINV